MNQETKFVSLERRGHIAIITIRRPEVMNALHPPATKELDFVWTEYINDSSLRVAIFTGEGDRAFCAGADLKYRANEADQQELRNPGENKELVIDRCLKPIIAAVNGAAIGGGLELMLKCDIIVASSSARFGTPEAKRGLLADGGGVIYLPRQIPYHFAMEMLLSGKIFGADRALQLGIVNEVVPQDQLMTRALEWADIICECSPLALQATKEVVKKTLDLPAATAYQLMENLSSVRRLRNSFDYEEGPKAFAEKRKPEWRGE